MVIWPWYGSSYTDHMGVKHNSFPGFVEKTLNFCSNTGNMSEASLLIYTMKLWVNVLVV